MPIQRVNILGVAISAVNICQAIQIIDRWIANDEHHYVCVTGVHGIMESQRDDTLRQIHNRAGLVTPDGMPLVWLSILKGYRGVERVYGPDLMLAMCEHSTSLGYRHFLYGGAPEVLERLQRNLQQSYPQINIVGMYSPPFRPLTAEEDRQVIQLINAAGAHMVWVGLSTPKQELWMASHVQTLSAPVLIGVGAAFDFHAGTKRQAPLWMQRTGLEWFFRLITEPRRLWKRYLINNPLFIILVLAQVLGIKHFPKID